MPLETLKRESEEEREVAVSYTDTDETYRGHKLRIVADDDCRSPREDYDNFGTMACWHRRIDLGDERIKVIRAWLEGLAGNCIPFEVENLSDDALWKIVDKYYLVLPLALLDHSGLHMWVGSGSAACDPGGWDSGQVGFIYVSHGDIRKNWSVKSVRHNVRHHTGKQIKAIDYARELLEAEVKIYDQFLSGDVWGYEVEDGNGWSDSCWGFYGTDCCLEEAKRAIDWHVASSRKKHCQQVKGWIKKHVPLQYRESIPA